MICNKCNSQIADDSTFCGFCGNAINSNNNIIINEKKEDINPPLNIESVPIKNDNKQQNIDLDKTIVVSNEPLVIEETNSVSPSNIKISKIFIAITILLTGLGTIGFLLVTFFSK